MKNALKGCKVDDYIPIKRKQRVQCHRLNFVLMRHCKRQLDASHMSEKERYSSQQCFFLFVPSIQPLNFERWERSLCFFSP